MRKVEITSVREETPTSTHLDVAPDPKMIKTYRVPGQYVAIRLPPRGGALGPGPKEGYFALANPPAEEKFSFLVKKSSPLSKKLAGLKKGGLIELSEIQGKGFAMERVRGRHVLLLAVGSAIGPIRAALLHMLKTPGNHQSITLYFGAINAREFAYAAEFSEWKKKGVKLVRTVYPPDPSWKGLNGFVQNHLPKTLPADTAALLCGMDRMVQAARKKLNELGVPENLILVNV